jgi:hypothetical protein
LTAKISDWGRLSRKELVEMLALEYSWRATYITMSSFSCFVRDEKDLVYRSGRVKDQLTVRSEDMRLDPDGVDLERWSSSIL